MYLQIKLLQSFQKKCSSGVEAAFVRPLLIDCLPLWLSWRLFLSGTCSMLRVSVLFVLDCLLYKIHLIHGKHFCLTLCYTQNVNIQFINKVLVSLLPHLALADWPAEWFSVRLLADCHQLVSAYNLKCVTGGALHGQWRGKLYGLTQPCLSYSAAPVMDNAHTPLRQQII